MKLLFSTFSKLLLFAVIGALFYYYPGHIQINWQSYNLETSLAVFACLLALSLMCAYYGFLLCRAILLLPFTLRRAYLRSRHLDPQHSVVKYYLAWLLNDAKSAKRLQKYLKHSNHDPLAIYLRGEVAWQRGEKKKAMGWSEILQREKNAVDLSRYQLLRWHEEKGDLTECLNKAQELLQDYPHSSWLLEKVFTLLVRTQQYNDLPPILERMKHEGYISETQFKRKRAVIFYLQAEQLLASHQHDIAIHYLERAHTLAPDYVGITLRLLECAKNNKNSRWMKRIIEEAWAHTPHPELYSAYVELIGGAASERFIDYILQLTTYNPQHIESYHARVRAYLDAMLWGEARAALKEMTVKWGETSLICQLWAELEHKEYNNITLQAQWLQRALDARADSPWKCEKCCIDLSQWHPWCQNCHTFDNIHCL